MRFVPAFLITFLLSSQVIFPTDARAEWSTDPSVNNKVCSVVAYKDTLAAIPDSKGGAYFVWQDYRPTPAIPSDARSIYAQHVDAEGNDLWTSAGVAVCLAFGVQATPALALDASGGVFIVWYDDRNGSNTPDFYGQHLFADGSIAPGWA